MLGLRDRLGRPVAFVSCGRPATKQAAWLPTCKAKRSRDQRMVWGNKKSNNLPNQRNRPPAEAFMDHQTIPLSPCAPNRRRPEVLKSATAWTGIMQGQLPFGAFIGGQVRVAAQKEERMALSIERRALLAGLSGAAVASLWPAAGRAQKPAMPVIGWLSTARPEAQAVRVAAFRRGLGEMGYAEGQNVAFEFRWADEQRERLPGLAAELVAAKVAVIIASDGPGTARPALAATKTIPIIYQTGGDPVKDGLVASMRRVGGNVTAVARWPRMWCPSGSPCCINSSPPQARSACCSISIRPIPTHHWARSRRPRARLASR